MLGIQWYFTIMKIQSSKMLFHQEQIRDECYLVNHFYYKEFCVKIQDSSLMSTEQTLTNPVNNSNNS